LRSLPLSFLSCPQLFTAFFLGSHGTAVLALGVTAWAVFLVLVPFPGSPGLVWLSFKGAIRSRNINLVFQVTIRSSSTSFCEPPLSVFLSCLTPPRQIFLFLISSVGYACHGLSPRSRCLRFQTPLPLRFFQNRTSLSTTRWDRVTPGKI